IYTLSLPAPLRSQGRAHGRVAARAPPGLGASLLRGPRGSPGARRRPPGRRVARGRRSSRELRRLSNRGAQGGRDARGPLPRRCRLRSERLRRCLHRPLAARRTAPLDEPRSRRPRDGRRRASGARALRRLARCLRWRSLPPKARPLGAPGGDPARRQGAGSYAQRAARRAHHGCPRGPEVRARPALRGADAQAPSTSREGLREVRQEARGLGACAGRGARGAGRSLPGRRNRLPRLPACRAPRSRQGRPRRSLDLRHEGAGHALVGLPRASPAARTRRARGDGARGLPRASAAHDRCNQVARRIDVRAAPHVARRQARPRPAREHRPRTALAPPRRAPRGGPPHGGQAPSEANVERCRSRRARRARDRARRHARGDVPRVLRCGPPVTAGAAEVFFDAVAGRYERAYALPPAESRRRMTRALAALPSPPARVLDLGVGTGRELPALLDAGYLPTGLDASRAMLARCSHRARPVPLVRADFWASPLPFEVGAFDAALALHGTLAHPPDDDAIRRLAGELARVVRSGGALVIEVPSPAWLERPPEALQGIDRRVRRTGARTS